VPSAAYEMNEPTDESRLVDSGPLGLDGEIGDDVTPRVVDRGIRGHRFPFVSNTELRPEHVDLVPDDPALDPGNGTFTLVVRFRTRVFGRNVVQKGQSNHPGGYWKFQVLKERPECLFRGADPRQQRTASTARDLHDGAWHTVRCERTDSSVSMYIDDELVNRREGPTGTIDNTWPLSIGGKSHCDQVTVGCDYFVGDIDFVRIDKG
jgi:hypothetical protein